MVAETRALYSDLANRRHFTESGQPIHDTRHVLAELSAPAVLTEYELEARVNTSATNLQQAADTGFVEVG